METLEKSFGHCNKSKIKHLVVGGQITIAK